MRDLEKEVATLRVENDLLKARVKSDPNDERLKAIDFVVQALRTGEFESLSLKMEEISNKQIETVWGEGIKTEKIRRKKISQKSGSKGGRISAKEKRLNIQKRDIDIIKRAKDLKKTNSDREIAGILAKIYGLSPTTIRNILRKAKVQHP